METGRVEAFSDGVFAIAITLLILAVAIDQARAHGALSNQLLHLWPAYLAYGASFLTSGITRSYLPGTPMYATATLIAFASPIASLVIYGAIALFYAISSSLFGKAE